MNSEESDIAINNFVRDYNKDEFIAKSGNKWTSAIPPRTRLRQCDIVRGSPGPTSVTNAATPMFFDDQIVDTICNFTNAEHSRAVQDFNINAVPNSIRIRMDVETVEIITFFWGPAYSWNSSLSKGNDF